MSLMTLMTDEKMTEQQLISLDWGHPEAVELWPGRTMMRPGQWLVTRGQRWRAGVWEQSMMEAAPTVTDLRDLKKM